MKTIYITILLPLLTIVGCGNTFAPTAFPFKVGDSYSVINYNEDLAVSNIIWEQNVACSKMEGGPLRIKEAYVTYNNLNYKVYFRTEININPFSCSCTDKIVKIVR